MRKTREQKGITLIALIITIVVLLILAIVTINSIKNDGIIDYSKQARDEYQAKQEEEGDVLQNFEDIMDDVNGELHGWSQDGTVIKHVDGRQMNVGDYVTGYTAGDTSVYAAGKNWQVLGADNGKVLLTIANKPDNPNTSDSNEDGYITLSGKNDYTTTGVTKLQTEANKYLNTTYADSVRSMNLDDINRITGYDPNVAKFKHDVNGEVGRYGNIVKYKKEGTYIEYTGLDGGWITANVNKTTEPENEENTVFIKLDGTALTSTEFSETSNYYRYTLSDYLKDTNSQAYKMIIGTNTHNYWLANKYTYTRFGRVVYGICTCANGKVDGSSLYDTVGQEFTRNNSCSVRPAVYLKSDIQFEEATTQINSTKTWNIK